MASNLVLIASNLLAMASNLIATASNLEAVNLQPKSDGLRGISDLQGQRRSKDKTSLAALTTSLEGSSLLVHKAKHFTPQFAISEPSECLAPRPNAERWLPKHQASSSDPASSFGSSGEFGGILVSNFAHKGLFAKPPRRHPAAAAEKQSWLPIAAPAELALRAALLLNHQP